MSSEVLSEELTQEPPRVDGWYFVKHDGTVGVYYFKDAEARGFGCWDPRINPTIYRCLDPISAPQGMHP